MTTDGPSTLTYLETRLNLLTVSMDKMETVMDRRFAAVEASTALAAKGVDERFKHQEQLTTLGQETAKRAVDKAEAAQSAHNVAANEWRGTLNDFKSTLIGRPEFDKLSADFTAYRLEVARLLSVMAGEKAGTKDTRDDSRSTWALVIAVATALLMMAELFMRKGG
jgi:hypothetical protein